MGSAITFRCADGFDMGAYRAEPEGPARGAVVVVQEIFGVNHHIRSVADRYAAAGYLAIAPAIFDRAERGVELGYTPEDMQRGFGFVSSKLDFATLVADVAAAGQAVASVGKVGVVGYCFGGLVTAASAIHSGHVFAAASSYYGGNTMTLLDKTPTVPLMAHYGELDAYIPISAVDQIKAAWPAAEIYVYGADHGFNCDQRPVFHVQSAALAQARTFRFFDRHLG